MPVVTLAVVVVAVIVVVVVIVNRVFFFVGRTVVVFSMADGDVLAVDLGYLVQSVTYNRRRLDWEC